MGSVRLIFPWWPRPIRIYFTIVASGYWELSTEPASDWGRGEAEKQTRCLLIQMQAPRFGIVSPAINFLFLQTHNMPKHSFIAGLCPVWAYSPGEDIQYNRYLRKYTSRWMQRAPQSCLSPGPTSWSLCTPKQPSLHTAKFRIVVNDTHPSTISTVFSDTTRENARVPELDFQEQTGVSSQIDQGSWTVDNEISLSWRWLHSSSENAITKQSNSTLLLCRQWTGCRVFFYFNRNFALTVGTWKAFHSRCVLLIKRYSAPQSPSINNSNQFWPDIEQHKHRGAFRETYLPIL